MFENLNELIEINLNIIGSSKHRAITHGMFRNKNGKSIGGVNKSLDLAKILDSKGLIDLGSNQQILCNLTQFGYDVYIKGGWLKHLEDIENDKIELDEKTKSKERTNERIQKLMK